MTCHCRSRLAFFRPHPHPHSLPFEQFCVSSPILLCRYSYSFSEHDNISATKMSQTPPVHQPYSGHNTRAHTDRLTHTNTDIISLILREIAKTAGKQPKRKRSSSGPLYPQPAPSCRLAVIARSFRVSQSCFLHGAYKTRLVSAVVQAPLIAHKYLDLVVIAESRNLSQMSLFSLPPKSGSSDSCGTPRDP